MSRITLGAMSWHLAQLNIGRLRAPVDDPATAEFMGNLDPINALAEATPGFVWRLQTDEGNATAIKAFPGDDLMILNMSVWESIDTLADYVYRSAHTPFLRRRGEWFERLAEVYLVLWWIPAGTLPDDRGRARPARAAPVPRSDPRSLHVPPPVPASRRAGDSRRRAQHLPRVAEWPGERAEGSV